MAVLCITCHLVAYRACFADGEQSVRTGGREEEGAVLHLSIGLPVGPVLLTARHAQCSCTRLHGSGCGGGASSSSISSAGGMAASRSSAEAGSSR